MKIKGLKLVALAIATCCCANAFSADYFDPLFRTAKVTGNVWILRPGETTPILAKEDFRYPYGSKVIVDGINPKLPKEVVQKNEVMVVFANDYQIKLGMDTTITTEKKTVDSGDAKVVVGLEKGVVSTFITLPSSKTGDQVEDAKIDAKLNAFAIKTQLAEANHLVDRNEIRTVVNADGIVKSMYKIESGLINLEGPQYKIVKTRRKTIFDITGDQEFTSISVKSGEVTANINRGEDTPYLGAFKQGSVIKLWRMYTKIQKKLAVAVMLTMPDGKVERFEYIENPSASLKALLGKGDVVAAAEDGLAEENTDEVISDTSDEGFGDSVDSSTEDTTTETTEDTGSFFSDSDDSGDFFGEDWDF